MSAHRAAHFTALHIAKSMIFHAEMSGQTVSDLPEIIVQAVEYDTTRKEAAAEYLDQLLAQDFKQEPMSKLLWLRATKKLLTSAIHHNEYVEYEEKVIAAFAMQQYTGDLDAACHAVGVVPYQPEDVIFPDLFFEKNRLQPFHMVFYRWKSIAPSIGMTHICVMWGFKEGYVFPVKIVEGADPTKIVIAASGYEFVSQLEEAGWFAGVDMRLHPIRGMLLIVQNDLTTLEEIEENAYQAVRKGNESSRSA